MSYSSADLFSNDSALFEQIGFTREEYTQFVNTNFIQSAVVSPTVTNLSSLVVPGVSQITCPNYESPEPTKINTDGSAAKVCITPQSGTYIKEILTPDCELGDGWCISRKTMQLSTITNSIVNEGEIRGQKFALARDKELIIKMHAGVDAANEVAISGASALESVDDIVNLRVALNKKLIPQNDRYILMGCDDEGKMLKMDDKCFIKADSYGSRDALLNGEIGRVMGFTVIVSTVMDELGLAPMAYHSTHAAYADWQALTFENDYDPKCREMQFYLSMLFGAKVMNKGCRAAKLV